MGKVLVMCAGEDERWSSKVVRQAVPVYDHEPLLARTVRQIRKRMNNYPHIISHQKCLRQYSANFVYPSARRWVCETALSVRPIWGNDWTMLLLGDVLYSDELIEAMYKQRESFRYHFYGTNEDIFGVTFTDNTLLEQNLRQVVDDAFWKRGDGSLWDLYHQLSSTASPPPPEAGKGYSVGGDLSYSYVLDGSRDFDSIEEYKQWYKKFLTKIQHPPRG